MVSITCFFFHAVFCFCFYYQSKFRFINQKKYPYITILMSDHFGNANRSLSKKKKEEEKLGQNFNMISNLQVKN